MIVLSLREPPSRPDATRAPPPDCSEADVSVIVVNYNTAHLLGRMFAALEAGRGDLRLQVIVVDNASRDDSVQVLRTQHPQAELIANTANPGFGRANNQALARANGRYVLLLNTDAFVSPDTLSKTVSFMDAHPQCGVLGVKLVGEDGALQPSCRYFPTPWNVFLAANGLQRRFAARLVDDLAWDHASVRECDWVPGCFYLVRREVIDRVGLFDPRYFLYCEEVDHCRAVRSAGWSIVYYPFTQVVHIGGESAAAAGPVNRVGRQISALQVESELLYFRKHHGMAGMLTSVFLTTVGDAMRACSAMLRHRDGTRAADAMRHTLTTLDRLVATRFGSRATR
jgi:N-acetylglucosaminyl-diphospho-decaprenol L-rhamnosyltransferase